MKKEQFKLFVQNHPNLVQYVKNKEMTWQQFYEIYDLYGENNSIWNTFNDNNKSSNSSLMTTIKDFFDLFKGIDLNGVQKALVSLDKAIEVFKGWNNSGNNSNTNNYEERPKYKYFED